MYDLSTAVAGVVHQSALFLDPHVVVVWRLLLGMVELGLGLLHLLLHLRHPGAHLDSHVGPWSHSHSSMDIAHRRNCGDRLSQDCPLTTVTSSPQPTNGGPPSLSGCATQSASHRTAFQEEKKTPDKLSFILKRIFYNIIITHWLFRTQRGKLIRGIIISLFFQVYRDLT